MPTRRTFVLGALAAGVSAACGTGKRRQAAPATTAPPPTPAPTSAPVTAAPGGPARFVSSGDRATGSVALTFHGSGDLALLGRLLGLAGASATPITVFAVGQWLEQHPDVAGRITGAGHELANHTYTHPTLSSLDAAATALEISRCRDVLRRQIGGPGRWFRPSGVEGTPSARILAEAGRAGYATVVGFDVDPLDYQDPGATAIVSRVAAAARAGSIISLHTGHAGTVEAFPHIIDMLRTKSLRPVTVHALLGA